ncbi:hypothetical protein [Nostoc punctiforme]|uniref:hypothetical protein n=1 Tax=Nostoc punctiforme TaxID=272131 RepID=UPI000045BB5B|nr:hypothetical protein [Nostoc punctiforme]
MSQSGGRVPRHKGTGVSVLLRRSELRAASRREERASVRASPVGLAGDYRRGTVV